LVMITLIITITLKYPAAVGEARMLQPPHAAASPGVEPPKVGTQDHGGWTDV
jgi:hypothetical protein